MSMALTGKPDTTAADSEGHALAMALRAAYLTLHRATNACVNRCALTADQFVVMTVLATDGPMTQKQLVARTCSDANTISAMLCRLQRQGLVSRKTDPADRRARRVTLTARGQRRQAQMWNRSRDLRERLTLELGAEDTAALLNGLRQIVELLSDPAWHMNRDDQRQSENRRVRY